MASNGSTNTGTKKRGFGSMDPERQRQIARQGGKAAHARGSAHEFSSDEARNAGRKGGVAVSSNRQHMAEIGRRGGEARGLAHARRRAEQAERERLARENGGTPTAETTSERPAPPESEAKIRVEGEVTIPGGEEQRPQTTPPPAEESQTAVGTGNENRKAS